MSEDNALTRWFAGRVNHHDESPLVAGKHAALSSINQTLTEYGELLEQVSADRAHLLKTISELQLSNAELSVSKAIYANLEAELSDFRQAAEQAATIAQDKRALERELLSTQEEVRELRQQVSTLKGQLTRARNQAGEKP